MRWGLALGAAATLGAAALIGTQWAGNPTAPATTAAGPPATSLDGMAQAARQTTGAEGVAIASVLNSGAGLGLMQSVLSLEAKPEAATSDKTEDVPADAEGPAGQRRVTTAMRVDGSGTRVTLTGNLEIQETRGNSRTHTRARLTVGLDVCPDKDGQVIADVQYQGSGDTGMVNAAGSAGYSVNVGATGQAKASVNDQALMSRIDQDLRYEHSTRGGQNPAGAPGQAGATRKATSGRLTVSTSTPITSSVSTQDNTVQTSNGTMTVRVEAGPGDDPAAHTYLVALTQLWLDRMLTSVFSQAQAKWRSGACLELIVRPPVQAGGKPNTTQPNERKTFEVAVRHKSEHAELPLPIDATLDGRDTLEPRHVDNAQGRFDYVAGPEPRDYGNVALRSVSRRGIAQERVAFDNDQRLGGSFSARTSGPMQAVAEGRVSWRAKPDSPDTFVPSGNVSVRGTRRKCTVSGDGEITAADGELQLQRDAQGNVVAYRGWGIKSMPLNITCGAVSATQSRPVAWFGTAEALRPIGNDGAAAGSLEQGMVHWTWRFTR